MYRIIIDTELPTDIRSLSKLHEISCVLRNMQSYLKNDYEKQVGDMLMNIEGVKRMQGTSSYYVEFGMTRFYITDK